MSEDVNKKELVEQSLSEQNVALGAYDLAIVEDFRARFKQKNNSRVNETVQIGPSDKAFTIIGQLNDDEVIMPFINIERLNWQLNLDRQGFQTFRGDMVYRRIGPDNKPIQVRAQVIPITINYRLSVYSVDRLTNDALIRELLFYYHLRPSLMAYIPHGLNIAHKFNIYFNSGIEENSDIANHDNHGTYFRQDLTFYTDDAYLWRSNYENLVKISPDLYFSYDKEDKAVDNIIETVDIEDNYQ